MPTTSADSRADPVAVPIWPYLPFAVLTVAHLFGNATGNALLSGWTQQWLMLALLLAFLLTAPHRAWMARALGTLALLGSSLGDNSDLGGDEFVQGLGAFAFAHLAYIALFWWGIGLRPRSAKKWTVLYIPLLAVVLVLVLPLAGGISAAVIVYALLILAMAVLASAGSRAIALGACLFVVSDAILAVKLFVPDFDFWNIDLTIMLCYSVGQGLIIWGTVAALRQHVGRVRSEDIGRIGGQNPSESSNLP